MPYFERTKKLSNILISIGIIFLLITIHAFLKSGCYEIIQYNFTNDIRGTIFTAIYFVIFLFSFIMGMALRTIAKDAKEELDAVRKEISRIED